jgi:hypothetical protein
MALLLTMRRLASRLFHRVLWAMRRDIEGNSPLGYSTVPRIGSRPAKPLFVPRLVGDEFRQSLAGAEFQKAVRLKLATFHVYLDQVRRRSNGSDEIVQRDRRDFYEFTLRDD